MGKKEQRLVAAAIGKLIRVRRWIAAVLAVVDDITAVTLGGFLAPGSGVAAVRAGNPPGRRR